MTRHGTNPGWIGHVRVGEPPCAQCQRGRADYVSRHAEGGPALQRDRAHSRAQARAAVELRQRHPDEWAGLYQEAKDAVDRDDTEFPPLDNPATFDTASTLTHPEARRPSQ